MSSSSAPPTHEDPHSFTTMDKDVEAIGSHCEYTYCNQLDFLPFRCESCKGTFCLDHRTETGHTCPKAGAWAAARRSDSPGLSTSLGGKKTLATGTQCSHPSCKTFINTINAVGVGCSNCNRSYCLKHRMQEDHDCAKLTPIGARPSQGPTQAERAKTALGRLKVWGKEKQASVLPKPKPSSATARILATNKLKQSSKGDDKVPIEKRIYLYVEAEAATTTSKLPKGEYWYSRDWNIGKLLDAAAKALQIQNVNNRVEAEDERLRVYHVEAGRLLAYNEKVGDVCVTGNTLVLLRGVGPST